MTPPSYRPVDSGRSTSTGRGRLPTLRRQHLPDPSRSAWHADGASVPHLPRAVFDHGNLAEVRDRPCTRRGHEVAGGRRRLLQAAALRLDAVGDQSAESRRAAARSVLSPSVGDRSDPRTKPRPCRRCPGPVPPLPQPAPGPSGRLAAAPARLLQLRAALLRSRPRSRRRRCRSAPAAVA